jgi:hypothetical protein
MLCLIRKVATIFVESFESLGMCEKGSRNQEYGFAGGHGGVRNWRYRLHCITLDPSSPPTRLQSAHDR